jgi:hypothetical protein
MSTIKKDISITPVSITKSRKKLTTFGFDPNQDVIYITYDVIALDGSNNELYTISSSNLIKIPQSRFNEPLIAAWITASQNMIQNEF